MLKRLRLNEKSVREAAPEPGRDYQIFDSELRGFAIPVPTEDACRFPRYTCTDLPAGRRWLAVGFDAEGRGCSALQSAQADDAALANLAAKSLALSKLALTASMPGFPIGQPIGRA